MRSYALVVDATASEVVTAAVQLSPTNWLRYCIPTHSCQHQMFDQLGYRVLEPTTHSQSCECNRPCVRDELVAQIPDRCVVVAVLMRDELCCIARCTDTVITTSSLAHWCHKHGIPTKHAPHPSQLTALLAAYFRAGTYTMRHQAQLYRKQLVEVE